MKVSLNIIRRLNQKYDSAQDVTAIGVDALVEKIGAQLGAVEEVVNLGEKYQGIIIVKVVSCEKHPNADKLSVCTIDDDGKAKDVKRDNDGLVQVVCGAPNVHQGMLAVWLPPGATVPSTVGKEPFVLEARELRGVVSNGMLASPKELVLGDSHEGLLEIEGEIQIGADFAQTVGLDDTILDIENKMFTHRPDCFGFLGIAREVAGIQGLSYKSPDWYVTKPHFPDIEAEVLPLDIKNELPELVPRFAAITMSGVKVGPSPLWLQVALAELGQKSINNIVDYTNFYMLETGQPLHAYDYDKVKALSDRDASIVIRNPKPGEKIKLLNGKEIEPRPEAIMIATDKQAIGIGGVMGGSETEVDENTRNVILECANFDMYSIRRTSMAHGLFTDAVTRFTKGQSPLQNLAVLAKIVDEIRRWSPGSMVAGTVIDNNHVDKTVLERDSLYPPVKVSVDFINARLGLKLSKDKMKTLLENVEIKVDNNGEELVVTAPFWRTDIELREDVVEEVGRLYGYDHLPLELPKRDLTPVSKDPLLELKARIRAQLARVGANELLTYSFVHGDLLNKVGQDKAKAFEVANALSPDLQYYRMSLMPSLLDKVHPNIKAGYDEFALFELGKTHHTDAMNENNLPAEFDMLSLVYAARKSSQFGAAYYEARQFLVNLAASLGHQLAFQSLAEHVYDINFPFEPNRSAVVYLKSKQNIGIVGEFKASVRKNLKLPDTTAGFEINIGDFMNVTSNTPKYVPMSRFPKITQDITLKVPAKLSHHSVYLCVLDRINYAKPPSTFARLEPIDIYQKEDDQAHKNVTFRLTISSYDRTLTDPEVNKLLDTVAAAAKDKLGADRI
jgi:phenylalanyl-tRNA synthetase beta chain